MKLLTTLLKNQANQIQQAILVSPLGKYLLFKSLFLYLCVNIYYFVVLSYVTKSRIVFTFFVARGFKTHGSFVRQQRSVEK